LSKSAERTKKMRQDAENGVVEKTEVLQGVENLQKLCNPKIFPYKREYGYMS
jgi:hypothetical protein